MATESDLPLKYRRPKLMIVGDSLAQGCRSLTVKDSFCRQSYGALLAQSQGWAHIPAQHPFPVVADVEDLVRRSGSINVYFRVAKLINENIGSWREVFAKPPAGTPLCFDNVAIAASDIGEIGGHGSADYAAAFEKALGTYDVADGLKKTCRCRFHAPADQWSLCAQSHR